MSHPRFEAAFRKPALVAPGDERKATWTELFFDLAFVVAVASTAHSLGSGVGVGGLVEFILVFVLIYWAWIGHTFYTDRFESDDLLHRLVALLQMALVVAIASLHDWRGEDFPVFVACYCALRGITILANLYAGWHVPEARSITGPYAIGFSFSLLPLVCGLWIDNADQRLVLVAATALLQLTPPIYLVLTRSLGAVNTHHIPERMGLFTTLSFGESFVALAHVAEQGHLSLQMFGVAMLGLLPIFSFWWIYFARLDGAALHRSGKSSLIWVYTHIVLVMAVIATAVGLGENLQLVLAPGTQERVQLLPWAWALGLTAHTVIAAAGNVANGRSAMDLPLILCLLAAAGIAVNATLDGGAGPIGNLQLLAGAAVVLLLCEILFGPKQ